MTQNETLSPIQVKAIEALISSRNTATACKKAKVSRATLYRWLREKPFIEALRDAERILSEGIGRSLLAGVETALEVLYSVMIDGDENHIRRNAANDWLNHALRWKEYADILPRLQRLEEKDNEYISQN